jgi:hypothetical protein
MDSKNRNKKNNCHWNCSQGNQSPAKIISPPTSSTTMVAQAKMKGTGSPMACNTGNEILRSARELCITVLHKAEPDDEPQRERIPPLRYR